MIDFHTHILPGIDDGSKSIETSLQMLEAEKSQGIDTVVFTPHFYPSEDKPERFYRSREESFDNLSRAAGESKMNFYLGAEVSYFDGISDCEFIDKFKVKGTPFLLIEMPLRKWSDDMLREITLLYQRRAVIPVIAHIDRYINLLHNKKLIDFFVDSPVLVQANASFFINKRTRRRALKALKQKKIHLIGSDCHNMTSRIPNLGEAIRIIRESAGSEQIAEIEYIFKKAVDGDLIAKGGLSE